MARKTAFVKPAEGILVRHENPSLGFIPAEGVEVELTSYYRRRIADGDLGKARPSKPDKTAEKGAK